MINKNKPDPTIDWVNLNYSQDKTKLLRPEKGFRYCKKCDKLLAVNSWNFARDSRTPDGYCYTCKECQRNKRKNIK